MTNFSVMRLRNESNAIFNRSDIYTYIFYNKLFAILTQMLFSADRKKYYYFLITRSIVIG